LAADRRRQRLPQVSTIQRHLRDAQAGQFMAYSTEVLATEIGREVLGVTG
jgi:alkylation response protein AidB-like acyl-CoA dehydrogenase